MKKSKKLVLSLLMVMIISVSTLVIPASESKADICFHPSTHTVPQQLLSNGSYTHYVVGTSIKCYVTLETWAVFVVCDICNGYIKTSTETIGPNHSVIHN